jgi:hypothetical protein
MTDADYRELGIPVPEHMRAPDGVRAITVDVREFYEGFRNPGAPPADRCEACGATDQEAGLICEGCACCQSCCNCTATDCDCDSCNERREQRYNDWIT